MWPSLPAYERRAPQALLAHEIEAHLRGNAAHDHLLGEAGTGTGKSLGYLIPAILSESAGNRVHGHQGSFRTRLPTKTFPSSRNTLGLTLYAILKGKLETTSATWLPRRPLWTVPTFSGSSTPSWMPTRTTRRFLAERDDFDGIEAAAFGILTTSADDCPGKLKCPFGETCFAERAKGFAAQAQIVVVNHALLLTHLRIAQTSQGHARILGDFDSIIFDEAHEIEEFATSVWQVNLRERALINFGADVKRHLQSGWAPKKTPAADRLSKATGPLHRRRPELSEPSSRRVGFSRVTSAPSRTRIVSNLYGSQPSISPHPDRRREDRRQGSQGKPGQAPQEGR